MFEYDKDDKIVNLNKYVNCLSSIYNIEKGVMENQRYNKAYIQSVIL